ncbi:MAG TPA: RNA polymerase sigma factor [Solirubrobacteraceae bacterium]
MEVSTLRQRGATLRGPTPLLRLQGDDRLVALTRRGHQPAYEVLVGRYEPRLLAFCRHMLPSREDAEDVLQEVFAAAFNAMLADERQLNVRPWLYRIARNRCLNHLRRQQAIGVDSMDVLLADHGTTTADRVHRREEFRELVEDVRALPETQRTALLLREIDALSYEQIAEAMDTTVPSIKSLLVRARVSLAEAAEARRLTCEEVREELGEVAEGLARRSPPVRRHLRQCERCASFDKDLRQTSRALAAIFPIGPLMLLKKFIAAQAATSGAAGAAGGAAAGTGALGAGATALVTKAAAGLAAAALVTAGAVEVDQARKKGNSAPSDASIIAAAPTATPGGQPRVVATLPQPTTLQAVPAERVLGTASATDAGTEPLGPEVLPAAATAAAPAAVPAETSPPTTDSPGTQTTTTTSVTQSSPQTDADTTKPTESTSPASGDKDVVATAASTAPAASEAEPEPAPATPEPQPEPDPAAVPASKPQSSAPVVLDNPGVTVVLVPGREPVIIREPQPTASPGTEAGDGSSSSTTPSE